MSADNETKLLNRFIDNSIKEFGFDLWIERQVSDIRLGVADVYALMNGIFLPIEAKYSFQGKENILSHKFGALQVERLIRHKKRGGYSLGMIFRDGEIRYILPENIREDGQMSLDQYKQLPFFNWPEVVDAGKKRNRLLLGWE